MNFERIETDLDLELALENTEVREFDYDDVPTLRKFASDDSFIRAAQGPFGCVAGETLVITEEGPLPISSLNRPIRVLSWNEKKGKFQLSLSGGAFPKGKDYLYQVTTQQGEFVAAGHHRVLCAGNKYRRVDDLKASDPLIFPSLPKTTEDIQKLSHVDGPHWSQTVADCLGNYAESARLYGQRLLQGEDTCQEFAPSQACARGLSQSYGPFWCEQTDGLGGQRLKHNQKYQPSFQKQTDDCHLLSLLQGQVSLNHTSSPLFSRILETTQQFLQFLQKFSPRHTRIKSTQCLSSPTSISEWNILSISKEPVKRPYWDMQVFETNNYVTVDGAIHHNSGKSSACTIELIRRGQQQEKLKDGVRRTRWAIVRNTMPALRSTTMKTVFDWFPPAVFGHYNKTENVYIIDAFEDTVIELFFLALDDENDIKKLLSLELTGAWINEAREIPKAILDGLTGRVGRYPAKIDTVGHKGPTWCGVIMDTNPPSDKHWWYKMFEVDRPQGAKLWKQPSGRGPNAENTRWLPDNYYKNMMSGKDEAWIAVYVDGHYGFVKEGKLVWENFNDTIHFATEILSPVPNVPIILGFDFGLNPTALIGQVLPTGRLLILDEVVSDGMGIQNMCENMLCPLLRMKYRGFQIAGGYGDPSGVSRMPTDEKTCFEILKSREINLWMIKPAHTNAIVARIEAVDRWFTKLIQGKGAIQISPACVNLREALNGGYHRKKKPGSVSEFFDYPEKNYASHIADATQYLALWVENGRKGDDARRAALATIAKTQGHKIVSRRAGY